MKTNIVKRIARIAVFTCILLVQEELLTGLPNIQLTQCLITIYFAVFGLVDTLCIVIVHTLLDSLIMGGFSLLYTPAMLIGWISLVLLQFLFRKKNRLVKSIVTGLHGFLYSWGFLIVSVLIYKVPFKAYFIADIPFELILVANGFITTFFLYNPLTSRLKEIIDR